jgi:5-oxoprolinase (ATP-hydrolysing)
VSDANLYLGRLLPDYFPKIFGPNENEPLDSAITVKKFEELAKQINASNKGSPKSVDEIVYGYIKVANETMCRPIRALTEAKGHDTSNHTLAVFGGAGGQHGKLRNFLRVVKHISIHALTYCIIACGIARNLGIRQIVMYRHSSILSAFGLALADVVHEVQEPSSETLSKSSLPKLKGRVSVLNESCQQELSRQGFSDSQITNEVYLNLRYEGTDCALMTLQPVGQADEWDFEGEFVKLYKQEFGFYLPDRTIIVDDIRIRGIAKAIEHNELTMIKETHELKQANRIKEIDSNIKNGVCSAYFETGRDDSVPIYLLNEIPVGSVVKGPAIIIDATATIVVEPACSALVTSQHVTITVGDEENKKVTTEMEPIQLSIFSHRFMSIAEQMGRTLQKTAISTNIKERLGKLYP